jgi:cytochrome c oxidase subunit 2
MARVQCAEVCGPGHPFMESNMKVVSQSDFAQWIQQEKKMQASS